MRRTSFSVATSTTLTEAPAELTTKAVPAASARCAAAQSNRRNEISTRRIGRHSVEDARSYAIGRAPGKDEGREANTAAAKVNSTQAGVEIRALSVNAWQARATNTKRITRRSECRSGAVRR